MNLTWTTDPESPMTITIVVESGDDPQKWIRAALENGSLKVALQALGGQAMDWIPDEHHAANALKKLGWLHGVLGDRLESMMITSRDTWELSWHTIGYLLEIPRHTARSRIETARAAHAARGWTYTQPGD